MRVFAKPFPLQRLSLEARVLYSVFCLFMLFGVGTSFWLAHDSGVDAGTASVERYYRGDSPDSGDVAAVAASDGGPAMALPDDVDAPVFLPKSGRQVVETFHFHAFTMPVCLLIVGRIFMMCALGLRTKILVISLGSLSTLLHLCLPPLVRFSGEGLAGLWSSLFGPSALLMGLTWSIMLLRPLWELWRPFSAEPAGSGGSAAADGEGG